MTTEIEASAAGTACTVEATPYEVDAGATVTLVGTLSSSPPQDLTGRVIDIRDQEGALMGSAGITAFDGEISTSEPLELPVPREIGECRWVALLRPSADEAAAGEGASKEAVTASVEFKVKPHETSIVIWDLPSTVEAGEPFAIKVGAKCSSACGPAGWAVDICDHEGAVVAEVGLGDEPWPGTEALYFREVSLRAPNSPGLYRWRARSAARGLDLPHEDRTMEFGVRSVAPAECTVTVEAVDGETGEPLQGIKVVVHPYRTFTDERGRAQVRLARGDYTIFVSGKKYIPYRMSEAVTSDIALRAELSPDVELTDADIWA